MHDDLSNTTINIALPKGRMGEESIKFLNQAGITSLTHLPDGRELMMYDKENHITFLLIRSKDVGTYVEKGAVDIGIIGYDLLSEHSFEVFIPTMLPFGKCRLSVAHLKNNITWKKKKYIKVATKYPKLTEIYFHSKGYNAAIIELYGSIETAPLTGISDIIVDLVSTGQTLEKNNLVEESILLNSQASLIVNRSSYFWKRDEFNVLFRKLTAIH